MTLREAVEVVLRQAGPMRSREIAKRIAADALYVRRDGSAVPPSDVNVTANDNKHIFDVDRGLISLRDGAGSRLPLAAERANRSTTTPRTAKRVEYPTAPAPRGVAALIAESFWTRRLDLSERRGAPTPDWSGLPEIRGAQTIRDRGGSDADVRLWVTFISAMDRARDADALWAAGAQLHAAAPWVFDPVAVAAASFGALVDALRGSRVSQRHGPDAAAWRLIAETLSNPAVTPAVRAAIWNGTGEAQALLRELQQVPFPGVARPEGGTNVDSDARRPGQRRDRQHGIGARRGRRSGPPRHRASRRGQDRWHGSRARPHVGPSGVERRGGGTWGTWSSRDL